MNSRQRRADRKRWQYTVRIDQAKSFSNYEDMFDWCCDTFGNGRVCNARGWREKYRHYGTWWQFTDSKKAALFALKWS